MTAALPVSRHSDDVRVARVHLRLGQLTLARAELEDLLRRDALDGHALAALAEARWRTGDAPGAAEAAFLHIAAGGSDDVALCIAAEAAAADGRATEARDLMDRLPASDAGTLDALFAGMPRRAFWPAGPVDRSDLIDLRREAERRASQRGGTSPPTAPPPTSESPEASREAPAAEAAEGPEIRTVPGPQSVLEATTGPEWMADSQPQLGRLDLEGAGLDTRAHRPPRGRFELDPAAELERARGELEARPETAFLRLALVLRHDPTFAPIVLELLRLRREPTAALVRGDAQRLLGRHLEAEAAFDAAAESLEAS